MDRRLSYCPQTTFSLESVTQTSSSELSREEQSELRHVTTSELLKLVLYGTWATGIVERQDSHEGKLIS